MRRSSPLVKVARPGTAPAMQTTPRFDYLFRMAQRLTDVEAGSQVVDRAVHAALGLPGAVLPYSTDDAAAERLLPADCEWLESTYSHGKVYAAMRRVGLLDGAAYPHHGQWAATMALARCGAVVRHAATLEKERAIREGDWPG
jgi:hypothetical protein